MPWGRGGVKKLVDRSATKLVRGVPKESFLAQLEDAWAPHVSRTGDIEAELAAARARINKSGPFKAAFDELKITDDDLRQVLLNIQANKPEPYRREEPKVGRNELCPCGSGKKYKKCCGQATKEIG